MKRLLLIGTLTGIALGGVFHAATAQAATLNLSPASGSYQAGQTVTVSVTVSSASPVNAVSGTLSFPANVMSVVSIGHAGSVVNTWVQEPSYSNGDGSVNFEGIILNPGVAGSGKNVLSIVFRFKTTGTAAVRFVSGSVLANDGYGTNVLNGFGNAAYVVRAATPAPSPGGTGTGGSTTPTRSPITQPSAASCPASGNGAGQNISAAAMRLASPTHPVETSWYNTSTAQFTWNNPPETTAVFYGLISPGGTVDKTPHSPVGAASFDVSSIIDGVYAFQVRARPAAGVTNVATRTVCIDHTLPYIRTFIQKTSADPHDPQPVFVWDAGDATAGIESLDIKVGDGAWIPLPTGATTTMLTPQPPGTHAVVLRATDAAGNEYMRTLSLFIKPLDLPAIQQSVYLDTNSGLAQEYNQPTTVVTGVSSPGSDIFVALSRGTDVREITTRTNDRGIWAAAYHGELTGGTWEVRAQARDSAQAQSEWTPPYAFDVAGRWDALLHIAAIFFAALGVLLGIAVAAAVGYYLAHYGLIMHSRIRSRREGIEDISQSPSETPPVP